MEFHSDILLSTLLNAIHGQKQDKYTILCSGILRRAQAMWTVSLSDSFYVRVSMMTRGRSQIYVHNAQASMLVTHPISTEVDVL